MDARQEIDDEPTVPADPATLGDVLYKDGRQGRVAESEWAALVSAIAAGRPDGLHALYERAHRMVYMLALRISRSRETAEEITLDVFHDIWRRSADYHPSNGTVVGWIMNQARSRAIDRLRFDQRKKRSEPREEPAEEPQAPGPHDLLALKSQAQAVKAALGVLNGHERQAVEASFFMGLTHAEIATRFGEPLGTIKTRLRSALQKLRQALGKEGSAT